MGNREPLKLKGFLITDMVQSLRTKATDAKRFPDYRYGSAVKINKTKLPRPKGSLIIGMAQVKRMRSLRLKSSLLTDLAMKKKKRGKDFS